MDDGCIGRDMCAREPALAVVSCVKKAPASVGHEEKDEEDEDEDDDDDGDKDEEDKDEEEEEEKEEEDEEEEKPSKVHSSN
ncbi:hypothetical protein HDU90_004193 [Geranomyces variabilis]|nr:hypothetical protein HDU90_004193 [Geranomyces variabilis]